MIQFPAPARGLSDYRADNRLLLLSMMAIPIGVISALVAKVLLLLIALITNISFFHRFSFASALPQDAHLGGWVISVPVAGALLIGVMARFGSEKIRGHGIPEAIEAILLGRSIIKPRVAILKPLSSAVSIGTGGPFGAEGPIIMTGGAFGSLFAQLFHLSAAERKTLLVAGAAGGMSAIFSTPVAAVLLAVELLLFEWRPRSFIPAVVSSAVAFALRGPLIGAGPIFPVPGHPAPTPMILVFAVIAGMASGLGSVALTNLVYWCEDIFEKSSIHWMWWPALGAIVVGAGGLVDPRVLGVGYVGIHQLLLGEMAVGSLILLMFVKAAVWSVALGSGTSGGVLAPLLIIGGAIGAILGHWFPVGDPGLWAMAGMAAMMAGMMNAPLTGMIFALELSHDLEALPVVMISCTVAFGVAVMLMKRSILTEKLARRGQHIAREYTVDPFELTRVGEVMDANAPIIPASMTVAELSRRIASGKDALSKRQATLIVDENQKLAAIITRGDVLRALKEYPDGNVTVLNAGRPNVMVAHPDELLDAAMRRMLRHNIGRLPVVDPTDQGRIVGYLGRSCILSARARLTREEELRERGNIMA